MSKRWHGACDNCGWTIWINSVLRKANDVETEHLKECKHSHCWDTPGPQVILFHKLRTHTHTHTHSQIEIYYCEDSHWYHAFLNRNSSPNTNTNVTIKLPFEALSQTEVQEQCPHFPRFENPKLVLTKIDTHKHTSPSHTSHAHTHTHYQICREAHQKLQNITCLLKHSMRRSVRFVKRWPWILKRPLGECNPPPPSHRHTRTNTTHTTTSNSLHRSLPWEWVIWWQKKKRREDLTSDRETKNTRKKGGMEVRGCGGGAAPSDSLQGNLITAERGEVTFDWGERLGWTDRGGVGGVWGLTNEQTCPHFYSAVPSSSSGIWTSSIFLAKSSCNLCRVFMVSVSFHKTFYWIIVRSKDSLLFRCSVLPLSITCYASHFASFMFHSPTSFFFFPPWPRHSVCSHPEG